jgi:hypothetical protein
MKANEQKPKFTIRAGTYFGMFPGGIDSTAAFGMFCIALTNTEKYMFNIFTFKI